jgi:hypothetical protein
MKMEVNIIALEATKVAVLEHRGPPDGRRLDRREMMASKLPEGL